MSILSCTICGSSKPNMMKCCDCNEFVCLGFNNQDESHISLHCSKHKHFKYDPYFSSILKDFKLQCNKCNHVNILHLNYAIKKEKLFISCNHCMSTDDAFLENLQYFSILSHGNSLNTFVSLYLDQSDLLKESKKEEKKTSLINLSNFSDVNEYARYFKSLEQQDWDLRKLNSCIKLEISISNIEGRVLKGTYCFYSNQLLSINNDDTFSFKINGAAINGKIIDFKKINGSRFMYVFITTQRFKEGECIKMKRNAIPITHDRKMIALSSFANCRNGEKILKEMIINPSKYCSNSDCQQLRKIKINRKVSLNDSQVSAVESAVNNRITLISGPPGTGKTRTICEIVRTLKLNQPNLKILISSDSNSAIFNAVKELKKNGVKVLRHISDMREKEEKETNNNELNDVTFSSLLEEYINKNESENVKKALKRNFYVASSVRRELNRIRTRRFQEEMKKVDVLCCTCSSCGNRLVANCSFNVLIIDEASQITEPSLLIPFNLTYDQLILLGDCKQLPPYVEDKTIMKNYKISMFKRLSLYYKPHFLNVQYRSHPEIASLYSELFYEGKISSDISTIRNINPSISKLFPVDGIPIKYIHHSKAETERYCSFYNQEEIILTYKLLRQLEESGIKKDQIGIICPYKQHKIKMIEYFKREDLLIGKNSDGFLEINVIDSYQGKEKEFIIINCVRSNQKNSIGFVKSKKRINVALSRAKFGLFIIGNPNSLNTEIWRDINKIMEKKHLFVDPYEEERILKEKEELEKKRIIYSIDQEKIKKENLELKRINKRREAEIQKRIERERSYLESIRKANENSISGIRTYRKMKSDNISNKENIFGKSGAISTTTTTNLNAIFGLSIVALYIFWKF